MHLNDIICEQIKTHGPMSFAEFMQLALYAPYGGYYSSSLTKLGAQGDFITAPELTPLFGQTIANQCLQVLSHLTQPILFEFGAGSGQLCVDILMHLEAQNALPEAYHILEVSGDLQRRQQETIKQAIPHLLHKVIWLSSWPETSFQGVVIANEVLDAMPVHRFLQTETGLLEQCIALDEQGQLKEIYQPCENDRLKAHIASVLPATLCPYQSEANLMIDDWIKQCYFMLEQGAVLICDYGFPAHEYYHPDRNTGTLMCHYQHQAHTNPLIHIGEQDLTAHVDFTHVAEAAYQAGFHIAGFTNQAAFLLANGLLNLLQDIQGEKAQYSANVAVKQLIQPSEMGELFKVIALTKNLDIDLNGFQLHDKRANL